MTVLASFRAGAPFTAADPRPKVQQFRAAFQKAYRLSRSYVFNTACWRKIDGAKLIKARHASPATHIEVAAHHLSDGGSGVVDAQIGGDGAGDFDAPPFAAAYARSASTV